MSMEEKKEAALRVLLDLAIKIQVGDVIVEDIDLIKDLVRVHDTAANEWVMFNTLPRKLYLSYRTPKGLAEEKARLEQYLKDHPASEIKTSR